MKQSRLVNGLVGAKRLRDVMVGTNGDSRMSRGEHAVDRVARWDRYFKTGVGSEAAVASLMLIDVPINRTPKTDRGLVDLADSSLWNEWLDGKTHKLRINVDFFCQRHRLVKAARLAASARNVGVEINLPSDGTTVVVQAIL